MKILQKTMVMGILVGITCIALENQESLLARDTTVQLVAAHTAGLQTQIKQFKKQEFPLHAIILNEKLTLPDKLNLMKYFLDNKLIDVNKKDEGGKTALNLVTFYNRDSALVALLLAYNANVNQPDLFNESPLHNAIAKGNLESVKMLLQAGADSTLKNDALETPIDLSRRSQKIMILLSSFE